ncbi:MAG: glycosyltransferase involved in cell wall biosynthesis [Halobacteriales archaeon]|jgi:glycosyltransferase involved in cell wall biosynthesis
MHSVGVVVPAYSPDVPTLENYVQSLREQLNPAEIRIELDDPKEGVESALESLPVIVNTVPERRGKGAAITAGFEALETDVLAFADADGSTPTESVGDVVAPIQEGRADLAVGSRRHPDARVQSHQTIARRYLGDGFAWLARQLLDADLYDYQCGAKAISQETWARVRDHLYESGFAWDIELVAMAAALDYRLTEVPVVWEDKPESTVSPVSTAVEMGVALLAARHRSRLLRDDPIHTTIAEHTNPPTPLVDRTPESTDE